ncbi:elongation factor P [Anoxybacter fermentans]|uniref:Elongation factor P n=1 Tax=Anoxybacter fermentans TaxID=1323375 RepID=A0A3S9SZE1_9FIRM|nr:elongation factor P [Anoxybacter fermentans]AZR73552.1 elongation factor P [Anoxybacter fermentans]
MISTNDFSNGLTIVVDGELYTIIEFLHVQRSRGSAFVRTKLKNVETGYVIEKTFKAGEKVERAYLDTREMQFLYKQDDLYVFMDTETYEQMTLEKETLGNAIDYLKENDMIKVQLYKGKPVGIDLPVTVELKVVETPPGVRGNTVSGGSKPATLETGKVVQVPLFINEGDIIKVDTRTGEYITRV